MDRINRDYIDKFIKKLSVYPDTQVMMDVKKQAKLMGLPILREPVACLLDIIIKMDKPKKILEIGTSVGYSTLVILNALKDYEDIFATQKVITIEMDEESAKIARENFKRAGVSDKINLFLGDAGGILPFMEDQFDFIFMDGPKAQYLNYLNYCTRLLRPGGILICDDVLFYGMVANNNIINKRKITIVKRMRKFLNIICNHPQYVTSIIPLGDGVSISYKKEAMQ